MADSTVQALVVVGSCAGMPAAARSGRQGIPALVERHRATAISPRAALIDQTPMEVVRSLGLEDVE